MHYLKSLSVMNIGCRVPVLGTQAGERASARAPHSLYKGFIARAKWRLAARLHSANTSRVHRGVVYMHNVLCG